MQNLSPDERFYVAVAAEVDEDDLIADVVFEGVGIASVHRRGDALSATFYVSSGRPSLTVPLEGLLVALNEARRRLASFS
jgi:hypothetical protein